MPGRDLSLLIAAAQDAGKIAEQYFRADPKVWDKGDGQGPVTEADLKIDRMLKDRLTLARPDYGWLSEETEDDPERLKARRIFIIDPIDGTRSFVAGHDTFAHSLAIAEDGIVTVGVVYLPMLDLLYTARLGDGAALNGNAISCSREAVLGNANVLAAKPQLDPSLWPGGVPDVNRHFRSSLAYRLCLVAEGKFDAMLTLRDAWEWDIAAGTLISSEAGAHVSDRLNAPLRFNNPAAQTAGVIVAGAGLHHQIMQHLHA